MEFRKLGRTNENVGVIGLGCEHLDRKPYEQVAETIDAALDIGVNLLDVFMPGEEVRTHVAKAIGGRRKNLLIQGHIGASDVNQQYDISRDMPTVKKYFETLLRLFGYIDFGMLFFIDSEDDFKNVFETEFIEYARKLKRQGDIRHIGFSSHNPATAKRVIATGEVDMLMFSINPAFDMLPPHMPALEQIDKQFAGALFRGIDPERAALYDLCERENIGITVMKALGAGKLLSADHTPYAKPLTLNQCVHYALSRPAAASVLPGCRTAAEMRQIAEYLSASAEEKDFSDTIRDLRADFAGNCVYCSHCQPCPAEIDIAGVHKYLDIARLDTASIPPSVRSHYAALPGGTCIECGNCESRCPFGVKIIENLKEAGRIFA
ncbi:MAG: aldo/keto reductase [Defluviitaleaceae bacterium]|nr:aldo/keto reductase [Defluviitaleaceae bacterium]